MCGGDGGGGGGDGDGGDLSWQTVLLPPALILDLDLSNCIRVDIKTKHQHRVAECLSTAPFRAAEFRSVDLHCGGEAFRNIAYFSVWGIH